LLFFSAIQILLRVYLLRAVVLVCFFAALLRDRVLAWVFAP
jgi:hypothetical protein